MIEIKGLTKQFERTTALKNIDFQVEEGGIYGLIGSNGSGKSTLLRLISGIYFPEKGEVLVDGEPVFNNPVQKSKIAFLGDTPYFLPQSNLKDMAEFYSSLYPDFDYKEFERLLDIFPLNKRARLSTFSKGMQRQAALILSLSTHPKYLLMDEAFDGLDVVMRKVLASLVIEGTVKGKMTVIISSHNLRELSDICDRIALIHNGDMLLSGSVEDLVGSIRKLQVAFEKVPDLSVFSPLNILKIERTGSLLNIVARGDEKEILDFVNKLSPLFVQCIEPTLEELFIFELEVIGYDVKNILS